MAVSNTGRKPLPPTPPPRVKGWTSRTSSPLIDTHFPETQYSDSYTRSCDDTDSSGTESVGSYVDMASQSSSEGYDESLDNHDRTLWSKFKPRDSEKELHHTDLAKKYLPNPPPSKFDKLPKQVKVLINSTTHFKTVCQGT